MAKTKRKHLAAIAAEKKQRHLLKHDVKPDPTVESLPPLLSHKEQGHLLKHDVKPDPLAQSLPSHQQRRRQAKHAVEPDPVAESSSTLPSHHTQGHQAKHDVEPDPVSPTSPSHHDDNDSDSWVEVRKQRVIIIIPPLPKAQPKPRLANQEAVSLPKNAIRNFKRRSSTRTDEGKATGKVSQTAVCHAGKVPDGRVSSKHVRYNKEEGQTTIAPVLVGNVMSKRKWNKDNSMLNKEGKRKRLASCSTRKSFYTADPPISSMDILLASALDADKTSSGPWQKGLHQQTDLLVTSIQEDASLDTADSSIQPKRFSCMKKDGMKSSLGSDKSPLRHARKMRTSLRMPAHLDVSSAHRKPLMPKGLHFKQHVTSLGINAYENLRNLDSMEREERAYSYCSFFPSILTANQAFKVLTLKKQLEKAGGLRKWLRSVGLDQFKEVFETRTWSEAELLQLNMDDLKKMGKPAVGPRRKLIWSINHLSQQLI